MTKRMKPKMPEKPIESVLTRRITVKLAHDFGRFSSGSMAMTMNEAVVKDEKGKVVGFVRGDAMGPVLHFLIGERMWTLNTKEVWKAVWEIDQVYQSQ